MKSVSKKMLNVLKKVTKVKKSGFNKHQNYHYSTEPDLIDAIREHLLSEGLVLTTSVESVSMTESITQVITKHTVVCSETGESLTMNSVGFGNLTVGKDKSVYAAATGSLKTFITKNFLIASDDDPEKDEFDEVKPQKSNSFNRTKTVVTTNPTPNSTAQIVVEHPPEVKVVAEQPKVDTNTQVEAKPATLPVKKSFGQRTLIKAGQTKTEPNF